MALRHTLEALLQKTLESVERNNNRFRASLYYFHEGRFHMIARYSSNPQLSVQGRLSYSIDQGVIGRVWLEEFAIATMPKDPNKWVDHAVRTYGFSLSDAEKVSMRARKLGGFTIRSANRCVGVVMLETFEPDDLSVSIMDKCRDHIEGTPLAEIVAKSATLFPAVEAFERTSRTTVTRAVDESAWVTVSR